MTNAAPPDVVTMADGESKEALESFLHAGRSGRRNAVPDILSYCESSAGSVGELTQAMIKIACKESSGSNNHDGQDKSAGAMAAASRS